MLPGVDEGPRALLYGRQQSGGKLQFAHYREATDDLWFVIELSAGECDALVGVKRSDGRPMPAPGGTAWEYWWYPGTAAGQVDLHLQAVLPTWNEPFAGTCYVVGRLKKFGSIWKAEMPEMIWSWRARKCLMPDTGLYVYSENVWDQWYDFVRAREGKALPSSRVDAASFVAARAADAAAGRKTDCHMALFEEQDPDDVIKTFAVIARAYWFFEDVRFRVVADRPGTPAVTYNDDAFSRAVPVEATRSDLLSRVNKVIIRYTDVSGANGFQQKSYSYPEVDPPDPIYEEDLDLPHVHDPSMVKTIAVYRWNSVIFDARVTGRWLATTEASRLGDLVTCHLENKGLLLPTRVLRRKKNADNTFDVLLLEHNNLKHAEYGITEPTRIPSTLPDPYGDAPNVDLATLGATWTESLFQTQDNTWLPHATFSVNVPVFAYLDDKIAVHRSINGGPSAFWFYAAVGSNTTPALLEAGNYLLTFYTRNRLTQQSSAGTTFAVVVNGVTGSVPDVVDFRGSMVNPANASFNAPQARVTTLWGAGFWSNGAGLTSFVASAVCDGSISSAAFTDSVDAHALTHFSDTSAAGPWTAVTEGFHVNTFADAAPTVKKYTREWAAAGSHRWWSWTWSGGSKRLVFDAGAGNARAFRGVYIYINTFNRVVEFQPIEYGPVVQGIRGYRVYVVDENTVSGNQKLAFPEIPVGAAPTAAKPINVEHLVTRINDAWNTGGEIILSLKITAVATNGTESVGVLWTHHEAWAAIGGAAPYVPQVISDVGVVSGSNTAVAVPAGPGSARFVMSGAAGPPTLHGLDAPTAAVVMPFVNVSGQTIVVQNESATETVAANRILTPGGTPVSLPDKARGLLTYDTIGARWWLYPSAHGGIIASFQSSTSWNPGTIPANGTATKTITVPGVAIGDHPLLPTLTTQTDQTALTSFVISANTMRVTLKNLDPTNAVAIANGGTLRAGAERLA